MEDVSEAEAADDTTIVGPSLLMALVLLLPERAAIPIPEPNINI